jgi:5-methylthioadenosine/S-adenosylhomocysteine deaminase
MKIFSALFVLPISSPPIENGALAFDKDKIFDIGTTQELLRKYPQAQYENFGEAVILPGFVNVHSHLELTALRGLTDRFDDDFPAWLLKISEIRDRILSPQEIEIAALAGALEGARAGVTCFADIGRFGKAGFQALEKVGLRGISFQETEFSPDNKTAEEDFLKLKEKFLGLKENETDLVKIGLSPHAPYTVSRRLFEKIAEYAVENEIKITIHASESAIEEELMRTGTGFFAGIYEKYGFEWQTPYCSTIEFLSQTGILQAKPLLAHCVRVSDKDIELIKNSGSGIAHCPKSNAKFGHGIAPFEKFLAAQIKTGFGSDSVASNNLCDILEEARFATLIARNLPKRKKFLQPPQIIETATLSGAKALGLENEIGSLEVGKQADFTIISLKNVAQMPVYDVYSTLLFASGAQDVCLTVVAGREIYREGKSRTVDEEEIKIKLKEIARKVKSCI